MGKPFDISMLSDAVFKRWFVQNARSPRSWIIRSEYLRQAANYLFKLYQKAENKQIKLLFEELKKNGGQLKAGSRPATKQEVKLIYDSSVITTYRMLIGYSIENLVKAILILRTPNLIKDTGVVDKKLRSHLSIALIRSCGITLTPEEIDLINMFSWYAIWVGRYPVPLKVEETKPYKRFDGLWFQPGDLQLKNEKELTNNLYSKLIKLL